jgi:hypothetical protein
MMAASYQRATDVRRNANEVGASVAELQRASPGARIVLLSELPPEETVPLRERLPGVDLLHKPLGVEEIVDAVRAAINGR